jgi:GNAT superfamily N-acetyltransferase
MNKMESLINIIEVRKADITDLDIIIANNVEMAQETENKTLDKSTISHGVEEVLHNPNLGWYYLAEIDRHNAGQLMITREWSHWRNGYFWWIQSVFVHKTHREKGVYNSLHKHVVARAKKMGVVGLRLYVDSKNKSAQKVYERLGVKNSHYLFYEKDWSE